MKEKICGHCKEVKDLSEFYKNKSTKDGYAYGCKICSKESLYRWRITHKKYLKEYDKKIRGKGSPGFTHRQRTTKNSTLKRLYNLTLEQYEKMLSDQNNSCAVCNEPFVGQINVDHDHETGKVRGLLCNQCNYGLGNFKDNQALLYNAINYLRKYTNGK